MLVAVNQFFRFQHWDELRIKTMRIQRRIFRSRERELSREEYMRLLETAQGQGKERLGLLMETMCATGIRVSEVKYITVEAARMGRAEIALKGKIRTILLPGKLCRKLLKYAKKQKTGTGEIFLTRSGRGLSRRQIWAEMKALCARAGVAASKVFPHNLRHLFARTFYRVCRDVVQLADVLGHSSVETTRIYLASTGVEYVRRMDRLGLVC
ncbi:MAG: tyrosine-type recombinase/integrase [Oscillospiraceae bacterium]|nr:tyrosine-type recombinase/integrase [Oscillospiraceae bacterium]